MVSQNKRFSFKIKRQAKNVFPRDVERTVGRIQSIVCSDLSVGIFRVYIVTVLPHLPSVFGMQASANSVDPDQTPQNVASDQHLHCLPLIQ